MNDAQLARPGTRSIPLAPFGLGLAGLLPFWGLAVLLWLPQRLPWDRAANDLALATYAAIIISFLGGIRWGLAVAASGRRDAAAQYAMSVLPSLAAWALLVAPEPWRLSGLALLALVLGALDQGLVSAGLAPPWFGRLRVVLSGGASVALLFGALALRGS